MMEREECLSCHPELLTSVLELRILKEDVENGQLGSTLLFGFATDFSHAVELPSSYNISKQLNRQTIPKCNS